MGINDVLIQVLKKEITAPESSRDRESAEKFDELKKVGKEKRNRKLELDLMKAEIEIA
jgi:hypothetical protein